LPAIVYSKEASTTSEPVRIDVAASVSMVGIGPGGALLDTVITAPGSASAGSGDMQRNPADISGRIKGRSG